MARKHSKSKRRTHKGRRHRQRGGGWGFTGASSIPGTPGTVSNPQVFTGIGDCRAVKPGYDIPYSQYANSLKGLPGMSGGKRRTTRKQRGGRYGFYPEGDVNPSGQAWWAGSYAPIQRIACEGTSQNPLNPTHTGSSAPPGAADPNYYLKGGRRGKKSRKTRKGRKQRGGAQLAPATYGVGNVDSMYYYAPTAGYANTASTWKDSVGAPVQIQVPFAAREMNQACLSTGGHPPLTGALQKGGKRRSRKQRGGLPSLRNLARSLGLAGAFNFGAPAVAAPAPPATVTNTPEASAEGNVPNTSLPEAPNIQLPAAPRVVAPIPNIPPPNTNPPLANNVAPPRGPIITSGGRGKKHKKSSRKHTHKRKH
jgi:hypothetical protein